MRIYKAKAPANAQGELEICTIGLERYSANGSSLPLKDLVTDPQPGYYAVQVVVGDPRSSDPANNSDWIAVEIRRSESKP